MTNQQMFGSSREPEGSGKRIGLIVVGVAVLGGGAFAMLRSSDEPPLKPAASAAPSATAPRVPGEVPVPGKMRPIAGGTLKLGTDDGVAKDEAPVTETKVAAFDLDETEVTVKAYAACVTATKCTEPDKNGYCNWGKADRTDNPINCVDETQAEAYCAFVGKRLPTEPEWEFAARGEEGRKYPWKDGEPAKQLCWNGDGSDLGKGNRQGSCPVGAYPGGASPFGIQDMAGNVWEWTSSAYCPYDKPDCGDARHTIRGGAWNNLVSKYMRALNRSKEEVTTRNDNIGFRCAK